jgi:hypothetical protein
MPKTIKQLFVGAAALTLICAAACTQRKGSQELAAQLLKMSQLQFLYAEAYSAGYRDGARRDRRPEKEINCAVTKITPELLLPQLADAYSTEFSDDELRQAISFFESEAGKAYVRSERNTIRSLSGTSTEQVPEFTSLEVERINAFAETRVGNLILTPHSALAESAKEKIRPQFAAIFDQCRNAQ